ncbi:uncharacterized protein [Apostichopus japonicus]|uniref:uncharacterized protein n=1 Tax=Stichopus japonicus TaxID=307972 RepID=UPI003AB31ED2
MKPQTTNYDLFRISGVYVLLLGSCIASISCGSGCNDFGLKNIARDKYDGDWEFYSFVSMDISGCFLCARWQSNERKTFELLFPCLPEDVTGFINLNYFYSPSDTRMGNTAFSWQRDSNDECKTLNRSTSTISGGQAMYNSNAGVTHAPPIRIQLLPENSIAPVCI